MSAKIGLDISSLLATIVAGNPDGIAVADASGKASYSELDRWSNALANRINETVGDEPRVCLLVSGFDREGIAGFIGILKTPQILVTLDSEIPPANIAEIARQLDAGLCVYSASGAAAVQAAGLSIPSLPIGDLPAGPVPVPPVLSDLSRVATYKRSSGSTGGAKSAAHTVEGVLGDAIPGAKILELTPGAKLSVVSTFDSALTSAATLRTILSGATLLPVDLRFETPPKAAARLIDAGLTHVYCTPTAIRLLCSGLPEGGIFPELRSILLGGEKTTMADVRLLAHSTPPDAHLRATFASTETQLVAHTTVPLTGDVQPEDFADMALVDGVTIDILAEDGSRNAAGEIGRVQVTSKMITLGYQGVVDPAQAAKVTRNPDGTRSYMTDDMGYLTPDGRIVLTSRAGREIKIRGRRVDLGELEAWLVRQDDIAEAAAVVQPLGSDGSPRLTVFIKPDNGFESTSALRKRMQAELVAPMQPTAIVLRDELPRTPNQKIDRRALESDLSHLEARGGEAFDASGLLGEVAKIWTTVLSRSVGGPDTDFFDLGGDSISATVAALVMEEKLGFPVDSGFVYRYPVLSEQVAQLEKVGREGSSFPDRLLVPLTRPSDLPAGAGEARSRAFLIPGAYGVVLPFAPLAAELAPDWELVGILHPDLFKAEPKLHSVEATAERMYRAVTAIQPRGPYYLIGYSFGGAVAHELGRRLTLAGEQAATVILDAQVPNLMTALGKINEARRGFKKWLNRHLDRPETHPDELVPFRNLGMQFPSTTKEETLPFSYARASRILSKYRPERTTAPMILVKATEARSRLDTEDLGWGRVAPLEQIVLTPGLHRDFFLEPYLKPFAKTIGNSLGQLETRIGQRQVVSETQRR